MKFRTNSRALVRGENPYIGDGAFAYGAEDDALSWFAHEVWADSPNLTLYETAERVVERLMRDEDDRDFALGMLTVYIRCSLGGLFQTDRVGRPVPEEGFEPHGLAMHRAAEIPLEVLETAWARYAAASAPAVSETSE